MGSLQKDFYYKGLLSLFESIVSVQEKLFSWATVKIYYSLFYLLRSSLCCKNIAFVRKERDAFYFQNSVGNSPIKVGGLYKSDHRASIFLFTHFFKATDFLQSNSIQGKNPYEWVMQNRENVNYKYRTFYEPDILLMWDSISSSIDADGIDLWLHNYLNDNIYSFLEDHAIIALPLKRRILTNQDLINDGFTPLLETGKIQQLEEMINKYSFLRKFRSFIK